MGKKKYLMTDGWDYTYKENVLFGSTDESCCPKEDGDPPGQKDQDIPCQPQKSRPYR